jgi:hypothetical protein
MPPFTEAVSGVHRLKRTPVPSVDALFGDNTLAGIRKPQEQVSVRLINSPQRERPTTANGGRRRSAIPVVPSIDVPEKALLDRIAAVDVTGGLTEVPEDVQRLVHAAVPSREASNLVLQAVATYRRPMSGEEMARRAEAADHRLEGVDKADHIFDRTDPLAHRLRNITDTAYTQHARTTADQTARTMLAQADTGIALAEQMSSRDGTLSPEAVVTVHQAQEVTGIATQLLFDREAYEDAPRPTSTEKRTTQDHDAPAPSVDLNADFRTIGSEEVARRTRDLLGLPQARFKVAGKLPE